MSRPRSSCIAVLGGAGAMGRIIVRDLVETAPPDIDIVVANRDLRAARRLAQTLPRKVRAVAVDAGDPAAVAQTLAGASVLVNACHHDFNLRAMDAALAIGCHYLDLGGLFHVTRYQLRRHREFTSAGLLAICGMGSAPGIVNVMARVGADRLERVDEIHVAVGTSDRTVRSGTALLDTSYSLQTILDEASQPAAVVEGGVLRFVPARSGAQPVDFPRPIGRMFPAYALHSELATLPHSFRHKGVREVSFRIAFAGGLDDRLRLVHGLGLTATEPIEVAGVRVVPREVLMALVSRSPKPKEIGPRDEYEVLRVTLRGRRAGRAVEEVLDCHVPGMPAWNIGVDIDTGAPPSIVAQMLVAGAVGERGVLPPEIVVPPVPFIRELRRRGMSVRKHTRPSVRRRTKE